MGDILSFGTIASDSFEGAKEIFGQASAGNYDSLQLPLGVPYEVPAGKKFIIGKVDFSGSLAGTRIYVGYGDNSVSDSGSPPGNYKEMSNLFPCTVAQTHYPDFKYIEIPVGKYPCIRSVGGVGTSHALGIERDI